MIHQITHVHDFEILGLKRDCISRWSWALLLISEKKKMPVTGFCTQHSFFQWSADRGQGWITIHSISGTFCGWPIVWKSSRGVWEGRGGAYLCLTPLLLLGPTLRHLCAEDICPVRCWDWLGMLERRGRPVTLLNARRPSTQHLMQPPPVRDQGLPLAIHPTVCAP